MKKKNTRYFSTLLEAEKTAIKWGYSINKSETTHSSAVYDKVSEDKKIIVKPHPRGYSLSVYDCNTPEIS